MHLLASNIGFEKCPARQGLNAGTTGQVGGGLNS
jgi:hypothetical protein